MNRLARLQQKKTESETAAVLLNDLREHLTIEERVWLYRYIISLERRIREHDHETQHS